MKKILGLMLLAGMGTAHAATGYITVSGVVDTATGTSVGELGNTITATFLISLDANDATYADLDSSDNPVDNWTAQYSFHVAPYNWTISSSGGGSTGNSASIILTTENDIVVLPYNAGQPFDVFTIGGFVGTAICPQAVLDVKGVCDPTDGVPNDGFEAELTLAMPGWFSGTNLPGYINPDLNAYLGGIIGGNEYENGVLVGEFDATITSMTVSAALAPVPEPETYAMMLAGLGLVGWAGRRRKQAEI